MSRHTPRPWTYAKGDSNTGGHGIHGAIKDSEEWFLADVYADVEELPNDVAEANGRLMAAAPELLEACRKIVAFHSATFVGLPLTIGGKTIDHTLLNQAAHEAQAAIAKAEGR